MKKAVKKSTILKIVLGTVIVLGVLFLLTKLLVPKYVTGVVEGALIAEYYEDEKNHDVIIVGDCEVYENINPVTLWQDYGINSYIRGSAQQLIWQSYYLLEDALRYETPKVAIFNVLSLKYDEPQSEAYNRMSLEGMRWSTSKIGAIKASMMEDEKFMDYVFPILRYHSRITELNSDDFKYMFRTEKISHNGYYMRVDVRPAGAVPPGKMLPDYTFGSNAMSYLDKMRELCEKKGVELVLMKAPSLYPYWYDEWEEQIVDYAAKYNLKYINYLAIKDEIGLDFTTDTYDGGLHLNLSGADKLSKHLGDFLIKECNVPDRRGEEKLAESWKLKYNDFIADRDAQLKKLADGE